MVNATVNTVSSPSEPVSPEPGPVAKVVLEVPENAVAGHKRVIIWRTEGSQFREASTGDSDERGMASATVVVPEKASSQAKVYAGDEHKIINVNAGKVDHVELKGT